MAGPTYGKPPPSDELHFGIVVGQHHQTWWQMQEIFAWADDSGWDSAWAFDHFFSLTRDDDMGPCLEGWTLLGALAALTRNVQLGLMVTGITHRFPSVLFKQAVTVDHVSNGRLILGVGAAWHEREHHAYGIPFPPPRDRVDMFAEAMEMLRLLENEDRASFDGEHYSLVDAPFEPKPVHGHMPVMVGTTGRRMLRHVARYADLWDGGGSPEEYYRLSERLTQHCVDLGRDPGEIRRALQGGNHLTESVDRFVEHVRAYAAVGVRVFLFETPGGDPSPMLAEIASKVIPELRAEFAGRAAT